MSVVDPKESVLDLIRSAEARVTVVAPYIKSHALRSLIDVVPKTVTEFICVTRWLPEDIASGVCDIELFEEITKHPGGELRVHPHLHAKFYSNTKRCLVGSANLTGRGLGWRTPANVELLVELEHDFPGLSGWESQLLESSFVATAELRDQIYAEAQRLKESLPPRLSHEVEGSDDPYRLWVPTCTVPDRLWMIYQGLSAESFVTSAYEAAQNDLLVLSPPRGLNQKLFEAYVASTLRQMSFVAEIDRLVSAGTAEVQILELLAERLEADAASPEHVWRVLKLWLIHFFHDSYRLEAGQYDLVKGKELLKE